MFDVLVCGFLYLVCCLCILILRGAELCLGVFVDTNVGCLVAQIAEFLGVGLLGFDFIMILVWV